MADRQKVLDGMFALRDKAYAEGRITLMSIGEINWEHHMGNAAERRELSDSDWDALRLLVGDPNASEVFVLTDNLEVVYLAPGTVESAEAEQRAFAAQYNASPSPTP